MSLFFCTIMSATIYKLSLYLCSNFGTNDPQTAATDWKYVSKMWNRINIHVCILILYSGRERRIVTAGFFPFRCV